MSSKPTRHLIRISVLLTGTLLMVLRIPTFTPKAQQAPGCGDYYETEEDCPSGSGCQGSLEWYDTYYSAGDGENMEQGAYVNCSTANGSCEVYDPSYSYEYDPFDCCLVQGDQCGSDDDCCLGYFCTYDGYCNQCLASGSSCDDSNQCCSGICWVDFTGDSYCE